MKLLLQTILVFLIANTVVAQRNLVPGKGKSKKDFFGGESDFKEYRPFGLQLSVGPTFTFPTRKTTAITEFSTHGAAYEYRTTPGGLPGVMAEIGMIHLPQKRSKLSQRLKYIFISYIDWGIGVKVLGGKEQTILNQLSPISQEVAKSEARFHNIFATVRGTVHKNFYIGKKYFIDNGFGLNIDFNFHREQAPGYPTDPMGMKTMYYHNPLMIHVHYELGFGFRLSRRSMLIPSVQVPIFGIHEWRKGASDFKWFDSNYYPTLAKIKWTYLFEKKVKGCPPARVNDQDKNTMQNQ